MGVWKDIIKGCCSGGPESIKTTGSCCGSSAGDRASEEKKCPLCGQGGQPVPLTAVENLLKDEFRPQIKSRNYLLCHNPDCKVVYYNRDREHFFEKNALKVKVWLKDPGDDVPLCYCHKITRGQIKEAWQKGARTYAEVLKATGTVQGECNCQYENPAGKCCSGTIKKYLDELDSASKGDDPLKTILIEWFRYDKDGQTCDRCCSSEGNIKEVVKKTAPLFEKAGVKIELKEILVGEKEIDLSNSLRINGKKLEEIIEGTSVSQNYCASCTDLMGKETFCNAVIYKGKSYDSIPEEMIVEALMKEAFTGANSNSCCGPGSGCIC